MTTAAPLWPSYAELHARQLAEHRARAVAAARAAAAAAARHGARVTVFGSLAEGRFHRDSDLDLALEWGAEGALDGSPEHLAELAEAIAALVERHDIDADVVRLDQAPPRLAARIREHGRDPADLE
jgi:predicted nucleotidyltransferase